MKMDNNREMSIQNIWIEEYNNSNNNDNDNNNEINNLDSMNGKIPWIAIEFSSLISAIRVC